MARACTTCAHQKRSEIDAEISSGSVVWAQLAAKHGLSETGLKRHGASHVGAPPKPAPAPSKPKPALTPPKPALRVTKACLICEHDDRIDIERKFVRGLPLFRIEREHALGHNTLFWHCENHVPALIKSRMAELEARENTSADSILNEVKSLLVRVKNIVESAEKDSAATYAQRMAPFTEARKLCELLGRFEGLLAPDVVVQIVQSPQFIHISKTIALAVHDCDSCRPKVRQALLLEAPAEEKEAA